MTPMAILENTHQEITEEMQASGAKQMAQTSSDQVNESPRLMQWTENSARLLLSTYKDFIDEFSSPFTKKKHIWEKIAQILNENHGLGVTGLQCENKLKGLKRLKRSVDNNSRIAPIHRSHAIFKELDDITHSNTNNPFVHHINLTSSSFQLNTDSDETHAEQFHNINRSKGKRKRNNLPEWVSCVLNGVERRHRERMEKSDKLIAVLEKLANK